MEIAIFSRKGHTCASRVANCKTGVARNQMPDRHHWKLLKNSNAMHLFNSKTQFSCQQLTSNLHSPVITFSKISLLRLPIFKMLPWNPSTTIQNAVVHGCFLVHCVCKMSFIASHKCQFLCQRNRVLQQGLRGKINLLKHICINFKISNGRLDFIKEPCSYWMFVLYLSQ